MQFTMSIYLALYDTCTYSSMDSSDLIQPLVDICKLTNINFISVQLGLLRSVGSGAEFLQESGRVTLSSFYLCALRVGQAGGGFSSLSKTVSRAGRAALLPRAGRRAEHQ